MAENTEISGHRDRSPSYPLVPLETAFERLTAFEAHFRRSAARPEGVGDAWGIKGKAYADRTLAALRYFGLLNYQGVGKDRQIVVSDEGRKYLRAQQDETKREVVKAAALRPNQIAKFWNEWGEDRPVDAACLDELVLKHSFSEAGARKFLAVYDATIDFAGLSDSDKVPDEDAENGDDEPEDDGDGDIYEQHARIHRLHRAKRKEQPGMQEDVFTLKEGSAVIQWPAQLSEESYEDFETWINLVLRKAARSVLTRPLREEERAILGAMGYSDDDINELSPWQARDILNRNVKKSAPGGSNPRPPD